MNKEKEFEEKILNKLLVDLKDIDKYKSFKNGSFIYDLGYYQGNLLVNEINRLNNIINKIKQQLLNKKDIVEKSKYFKLVYYIDWNMKHEWDKTIVEKIDEIINIIEEANK